MTHSDTQRGGNRGRVQDRNYSKKTEAGGDSGDDDAGGGGGGGDHNESRFSFDKSSRRQLLSVSSTSGAVGPVVPSGVSCICCLHDLHTYVYYQCSHFVCLNCAVKMRVLCQKLDCPACRQDSKNVICTKKSEIDFDSLLKHCSKARPISFETTTPKSALLLLAANPSSKVGSMNPRDLVDYGICFDDDHIHDEYEEILENKCTICSERFARFDELDQHLRRVHKRFYCELCLENLKLFPYERKYYDSSELGRHRRVGDQDDYSFKGHPRCEHCDQRFFDRDELYRHYRKEHYYCHFCDSDGQEEYYSNYEELRKHFLKFHHLCEIDGCSANAAQTHEYVVFRTEIDFQAHKREKHAKSSKDAKALSKLNIEFSINDSGRVRAGGGGGGYRAGGPKKPTGGRSGASANPVDSTSDDDSGPSAASNRQRNTGGASNTDYRSSRNDNHETEEDRKRQRNLQKLREKHENYEQTMAEAAAAVIPKAPTSSTLNSIEPQEAEKKLPEAAQAVPAVASAPSTSTWSIMAGSGGVKPTINNTAEFPSLGAPSSLAAIGATIAAKASWAQPVTSKTAGKTETLSGSEAGKKQPSQQKLNLKLAQKNKKSKILSDSSSESEENENTETESKAPPPVTAKSPPTAQKSSPAPPPGFTSPGIASTILPGQSPPPGFGTASSTPPAVVDEFPTLGKSVTSSVSNKENESTSDQFLKPKNYEERNSELSKKLFRLFGGSFNEAEFNEFKSKSNDFRLGKLSAKEYVKKCHQLLDLPLNAQAYPASTSDKAIEQSLETHKKFLNLIQEMIVLLPDVKKQSELYKAFETSFEGLSDKLLEMASGKKASKKGAAGSDVDLEKMIARCDFCPQYLLFEEMSDHEHRHHKSELVKKQIQSNKVAMAEAVKSLSTTTATATAAKSKTISEDFPSLASTVPRPVQPPVPVKNWASASAQPEPAEKPKQAPKQVKPLAADEFPALGGGLAAANGPRFSTMPTPNLFANPSAHLSLVNKKKHRLMK